MNTHQYRSFPKFTLPALCLHEANPGHHLESSYSLAKTDWPKFRAIIDYRIGTPSIFPLYTAFSEGWGLYSENLGYEMGLYDDPMDKFGHLS